MNTLFTSPMHITFVLGLSTSLGFTINDITGALVGFAIANIISTVVLAVS